MAVVQGRVSRSLRRLAGTSPITRDGPDEELWEEFWTELHHQGDLHQASYAAVPVAGRVSSGAASQARLERAGAHRHDRVGARSAPRTRRSPRSCRPGTMRPSIAAAAFSARTRIRSGASVGSAGGGVHRDGPWPAVVRAGVLGAWTATRLAGGFRRSSVGTSQSRTALMANRLE